MADSTPSLCPGTGPCSPWPLVLPCLDDTGDLEGSCVDGTPIPDGVLDYAVLFASQITWALTGRQFSTCDVTIRPCRRMCADSDWRGWDTLYPMAGPFPMLIDGRWYNMACQCGSSCSCRDLCEVALPYPVCEVSEVLVDGETLDTDAYRVDDFRRLVRTDGGCWPLCQNMALPDTEVGTWSVSLTYGKEPPQMALEGAAELACEVLKSRLGQSCKLPQRMVSLTRQGVTMSFMDSQSFFKEGRTGLYLMDLAIMATNPRGLARASGVYSPDAPSWRVTTS